MAGRAGRIFNGLQPDPKFRATRHIVRELRNATREPVPFVSFRVEHDNLYQILATIEGPPGSPYSGGTFFIRVHIPKEYPISPPKLLFLTPILHPNIDENGEILLDVLSTKWCLGWRLQKLLVGIVSILGSPDWENACVGAVLETYKSNPAGFEDRVKLLTKKYALSDDPGENQNMKEVYEDLL